MVVTIIDRKHINLILHECHNCQTSGHLSHDRTIERVKQSAWWPHGSKDTTLYCETCDRCQKANKATGKGFGFLKKYLNPPTDGKC